MADDSFGCVVVAAPSVEPVTLDEAKVQAGISGSTYDDRLNRTIKAARVRVENATGRKLVNTTMRMSFDAWPATDIILLPWSPLSSVTSITYVDADGDTQTWAADQYQVDADTEPGRVAPAYNVTWPVLRGDLAGVKVTYVVGYGASASDVPDEYRDAILSTVRDMFDEPAGAYSPELPAALDHTEAGLYA